MTIAVTIGGLRDQVSPVEAGCVTLLDHLEYIDQSDHELFKVNENTVPGPGVPHSWC